MAGASQPARSGPQNSSAADRLDSWKEIARHLKRSVRTVHRWEAEQGLPIHRHLHQSSGTVYAFKSELDAWWASRRIELEVAAEPADEAIGDLRRQLRSAPTRIWWIALASAVTLIVVVSVAYWHDRFFTSNPTLIRSIAVLPLENLTGDSSQDYVADSITEELTTELAHSRLLQVTSHTSSMQYNGARPPLREIAKNLGVDAVVEGAMSRNGKRIEINVQLIRASSDRHLWAQRYERDLAGLAALSGEIAWDIIGAVPVATGQGTPHQARTRPANAGAYDAYVRGRYFWSKRGPDNLSKALNYFEQAIAADPSYAPAYSGLSDTYRQAADILGPPRELMPKAEIAARKALYSDNSLAEAHASLAGVLWRYYFDWNTAEQEFQRALELEPDYAETHRAYGMCLLAQGRSQEALVHLQRAAQLDPLSPAINIDLAIPLRALHRLDEAIEQIKKLEEIDPNSADAQLQLAEIYRLKGNTAQSLAAYEAAAHLSRRVMPWVGYGYAALGHRREAEVVLEALQQEAAKRYVSPQAFAIVYMGLGDKEKALDYLEKAYEQRSLIAPGLSTDRFDTLRSEPRFNSILRRMGLPRK